MTTNLAIDKDLLEEARRIGGRRSAKETVTSALTEFILRRRQMKIIDMFGRVEFDPSYDYKAERHRTCG
ncbi:MAG: type II toxin-antitoxin system VapB family antitoxin [Deltaproteobacteria bacterium]|nr:type II toxin-antitoxin system VapB family antitoxin [Deltaproteobacteria bacterium]